MSKQINWKKTLNNIVYTHKHDEVIFKIKDIESLTENYNDLTRVAERRLGIMGEQQVRIKHLEDAITKMLLKTHKDNSDYASAFKVYA